MKAILTCSKTLQVQVALVVRFLGSLDFSCELLMSCSESMSMLVLLEVLGLFHCHSISSSSCSASMSWQKALAQLKVAQKIGIQNDDRWWQICESQSRCISPAKWQAQMSFGQSPGVSNQIRQNELVS